MAENIRMDSRKLTYHPDVAARGLKGENIYPIELEIGLSSRLMTDHELLNPTLEEVRKEFDGIIEAVVGGI